MYVHMKMFNGTLQFCVMASMETLESYPKVSFCTCLLVSSCPFVAFSALHGVWHTWNILTLRQVLATMWQADQEDIL